MSQPLLLPRAVLFDWDGTLVDTFPLLFSAYNYARTTLGFSPWEEAEARRNIRLSAQESFPMFFAEQADQAAGLYYEFVKNRHLEELQPYSHAANLLRALKKAGVKCAVVSNKNHLLLGRELEKLGWQKWIESYVGAGHAQRDKPFPDPVLKALASMGTTSPVNSIRVTPDLSGILPHACLQTFSGSFPDIVYIGDTKEDMECASSAGIGGIFIEHGFGTVDEIKDTDALFRVQDIQTLYKIFSLFIQNNNKSLQS